MGKLCYMDEFDMIKFPDEAAFTKIFLVMCAQISILFHKHICQVQRSALW